MADKTKTEVIIAYEFTFDSWAQDAGTFAMFGSLIGLGVFLDSTALQWVGAIVAFAFIGLRSVGKVKRMTFEEAKSYLNELEERTAR